MRLLFLLLCLQHPAIAEQANLDWPTLLAQMDSEEFAERDAATTSLQDWAEKNVERAFEQFPQKISITTSPEIRQRLIGVLRVIYIPEIRPLYGFRYIAKRSPSPLGNTKTILEVEFVMGRTAASIGGLKRGDQILSINGTSFDPKFEDDEIQALFVRHKPDVPSVFQIARNGEEIELTLTPKAHQLTPEEKQAYAARFNRWLSEAIEDQKEK